jgi:hypothetical protein
MAHDIFMHAPKESFAERTAPARGHRNEVGLEARRRRHDCLGRPVGVFDVAFDRAARERSPRDVTEEIEPFHLEAFDCLGSRLHGSGETLFDADR